MANGLMTNTELIDSIIEDVNNSIRQLVSGNYVAWSSLNVHMIQKLGNLKNGVVSDLKNREDTIEALKSQLREAGVDVQDIPVTKI